MPGRTVIQGTIPTIPYCYFKRLNGWVFQGFSHVHDVHVGFTRRKDIEGNIFIIRRPDKVWQVPISPWRYWCYLRHVLENSEAA